MSDLNPLNLFVLCIASSAILVNVWLACAVLERRRMQRVSAILAAISAFLVVWFYVALWGFKLLA
jgi:hypothetical protein